MELPREGVWEVDGIPTQERSWNTQGFWATHLGECPIPSGYTGENRLFRTDTHCHQKG